MTFKTDDRVYETSTTTGTGTYTLAGAVTGFQAFSVMGAGATCPYFATDDTNWEVGIGTIGTGPSTLARTTILASSNAGSAVNWGSGTRKIRCGLPADMAIPRALSKSVAGSSDVTLTADEQRRDILVFTGALTGNISVIVDATVWGWPAVYNNTTGAYTLTVKVSGQTGVVVPRASVFPLYCDGTDVKCISQVNPVCFSAYLAAGSGAKTMTNGAFTKIPFDTEEYDVGGYYDAATNYRFTPPAGKYRFEARSGTLSAMGDQNRVSLGLYKNGTIWKILDDVYASGTAAPVLGGGCDADASGTDYFEVFLRQSTGGDKTITGTQADCWFSGSRIG